MSQLIQYFFLSLVYILFEFFQGFFSFASQSATFPPFSVLLDLFLLFAKMSQLFEVFHIRPDIVGRLDISYFDIAMREASGEHLFDFLVYIKTRQVFQRN